MIDSKQFINTRHKNQKINYDNVLKELIKEWENNHGSYSAEQLEKLEEYFEVPIPEIIGYSIAHSELRDLIELLSEDSKQKLLAYAKDLKALEDFNKANNL